MYALVLRDLGEASLYRRSFHVSCSLSSLKGVIWGGEIYEEHYRAHEGGF